MSDISTAHLLAAVLDGAFVTAAMAVAVGELRSEDGDVRTFAGMIALMLVFVFIGLCLVGTL